MLPAVGQGALAVFARGSDGAVREVLRTIEDADSRAETAAERALLAALDAGCHAPVAARARVAAGRLVLDAAVFSEDGSIALRESEAGEVSEAPSLGRAAAERLLARGASRLLAREPR